MGGTLPYLCGLSVDPPLSCTREDEATYQNVLPGWWFAIYYLC